MSFNRSDAPKIMDFGTAINNMVGADGMLYSNKRKKCHEYWDEQKIFYHNEETYTDYCGGGVCEVIGLRETQQDACTRFELAQFNDLPQQIQKKMMIKVFETMQEKHGQQDDIGSTACMTISWMKEQFNQRIVQYCNSHVGDSVSFLVVLTVNDTTVSINQNKTQKINGTHHIGKGQPRCGTLNMTRAIGDLKCEESGLIHIPDVVCRSVILEKNERAFMITACDGLLEGMLITGKNVSFQLNKIAENVAKTVASFKLIGESLENHIAFKLTEMALRLGSKDNITVIAREINATIPQVDAVFDGHGGIFGSQVALGLAGHAESIMKDLLQLSLDRLSRSFSFFACIHRAMDSYLVSQPHHAEASLLSEGIDSQP